jgi:hypothetical protein
MKPVRIELLVARLLNVGTCLASVVIGVGLLLSLFNARALLPIAAQLVTVDLAYLFCCRSCALS